MLNSTNGSAILQEIEEDSEKRISLISHIRNRMGMSMQQAATFSRVTLRTWQYWEARDREMPMAVAELFLLKLRKICNQENYQKEGLVTVLAPDQLTVIDVVAGYNFLSLENTDDPNLKIISSVAVDLSTKQSYIHKTIFNVDANQHVIKWVG